MSDSVTTIGDHALRAHKSLKRVVLSKNLTKIGAWAFYQSTALEEVIFTPGSDAELDVSADNIFNGCSSLKELDLSTRNIKTFGQTFISECANLGKVTLPNSLETIGYCSIYKCPKLYFSSAFLPENLKTVGFHFLSGCKSVNSVLYFPEGFQGFSSTYNFSSDKDIAPDLTLVFLGRMTGKIPLEMVHTSGRKFTLVFTQNTFADLGGKLLTVSTDGGYAYVGKTADENDTNYVEKTGVLTIVPGNSKDATNKYKVDEDGNTLYYVDTTNSMDIYFCGGSTVEVCYSVRSNIVTGSHDNYITMPFAFDKEAHMTAAEHYDLTKVLSLPSCGDDGVVEQTCVVCKRVAQDVTPATGNHTLVDANACVDKCTVCLQFVAKEAPIHVCKESIEYANGFDVVGKHIKACQNEGCKYHTENEAPVLFEVLGFSTPTSVDASGLAVGFLINNRAIDEYTRITEKSFKFGAFAVSHDKIGTNDIIGADGAAQKGVATIDIANDIYSVEIKIIGFVTESDKNANLSLGLYVIEDEKNVSYIQSSPALEGNRYSYESYNSILSKK